MEPVGTRGFRLRQARLVPLVLQTVLMRGQVWVVLAVHRVLQCGVLATGMKKTTQ